MRGLGANNSLAPVQDSPLFEPGYVTVTPDGHFEVSRRIREDFENGREYYAMHGAQTAPLERDEWQPSK